MIPQIELPNNSESIDEEYSEGILNFFMTREELVNMLNTITKRIQK